MFLIPFDSSICTNASVCIYTIRYNIYFKVGSDNTQIHVFMHGYDPVNMRYMYFYMIYMSLCIDISNTLSKIAPDTLYFI